MGDYFDQALERGNAENKFKEILLFEDFKLTDQEFCILGTAIYCVRGIKGLEQFSIYSREEIIEASIFYLDICLYDARFSINSPLPSIDLPFLRKFFVYVGIPLSLRFVNLLELEPDFSNIKNNEKLSLLLKVLNKFKNYSNNPNQQNESDIEG